MSTPTDPCERCEPLFFNVDMEWANEFARMVRERDALRDELARLRRSLRAAEETRNSEGWFGMGTEGLTA